MGQPELGFVGVALRTVAGAAGVMDAVLPATVLARREAVPVVSGLTGEEGAEGLLVRGGKGGRALTIRWSGRVEAIGDGGHEVRPRIKEWIRWEASAGPLGGRCR